MTFTDVIDVGGARYRIVIDATSADKSTGVGTTFEIISLCPAPSYTLDVWPLVQSLGPAAEATIRDAAQFQIKWENYGL